VSQTLDTRRPVRLAVFLIIVALIGLTAAFALTLEKIHQLKYPSDAASCDFSVVVQCGKNLGSWQGSLLGFPNPLLGLMGWPVVLATAAGILAGARFARWYWVSFNVVAAGAFAFVLWLYAESVFELGTLCPWCMVTWIATIPLFWVITFWNLQQGHWGESDRLKAVGSALLSWSPTVILVTLLVEAVVAQIRLDWLATLL
jgi:uncharacterized membrane protein